MTGFGLGFGLRRQQQLVALARDVVDLNLDLLLGGPFVDQISRSLVRPGDPVVPETDRKFAGGMGAANIRRGNECCGC